MVRMKKPTGNEPCPEEITRALEVNEKIRERSGMRDLNDSDIADNEPSYENSSDQDDDDNEAERLTARVVRAKPNPVSTRAKRRADMIENISKVCHLLSL